MTGKKILLLNVLILIGILVCARELISGWQRFESQQNLDAVVERAAAQTAAVPEEDGVLDGEENLQHDFFVVAERNLFRPERRPESLEEAETAAEQAPEFPKRPKMSGVTERDGERLALLTTYETKNDAGRTEEVGLGEVVQGYFVTEITDTTLTLTWNDQNVIVDMLDSEPSKPVSKAPAKVAALNIIRIGSKVAAVESTASEAVAADEGRGLQVGIVGGQAAGRTSGLAGLSGRGGMMGRGGSAGSSFGRNRQSMGSQGRGFPSTMGGMGMPRQGVPNQQRRY
jgi:hypothetical protein